MSNTDRQKSPDHNALGPHQSDSYDTAPNRGLDRISSVSADDTHQTTYRQGHLHVENPTCGYDYDPLNKIRLVNPAEGEIVRDIFDRVIAGQSLNRIAKDLNQRGVPTKHGGPWVGTVVRAVATGTSYYGVDLYGWTRRTVPYSQGHREIVRVEVPQDEWIRMDGLSPLIISKTTFDSAQRSLQARKRVLPTNFTHHSHDDEEARQTK